MNRAFCCCVIIIILFLQPTLQAQQNGNVINQHGSVVISPVYQQWTLDGKELFNELSNVLQWYQPLGRNASLTIRGAAATARGGIKTLQGFADAQVQGSYYLEDANLVFNLGVNVPSGKKNLPTGEFTTSNLISNTVFRLRVPHFGAGLNVAPSVSWALPLSEDFVTGVGVAFHYRGPYQPLLGSGEYDAGEEFSLATGFDAKLDELSTFTGSVVVSYFMTDKFNGQEVFSPGSRILTAIRFNRYFTYNELALQAVYRIRTSGEARFPGAVITTQERIEPNEFDLLASFRLRLNNTITLILSAEGKVQQETPAPFTGSRLVAVSASPYLTLSSVVAMPITLRYTTGSTKGDLLLTGFEAGAGLVISY